jgi:hypothetical protein
MSFSPETDAVLTGIKNQLKADGVTATVAVRQLSYKAMSDVLTAGLKFPDSAFDAVKSIVADWDQLMHGGRAVIFCGWKSTASSISGLLRES